MVLLTKAIELAGGVGDLPRPAPPEGRLRHAPRSGGGGGRPGRALIVSVDTGIRAAEVVRRAGRTRHRRDRHRPPSAGSRTAARAGGAESQPARLPLPREEPVRRRRGVQTGAGAARRAWDGRADKVRRVSRVVSEDGGHRHGGRRGAAHRRESRHRQARAGRAATRCAIPGCARCSTWPASPAASVAHRPPGGLSDRAAHQRRRPHGYRPRRGRAVPDRRRRRAPANWRSNSTIRTPSASRWKPESARPASSIAVDEAAAALVYYAEDWHRGVLGIVASRLVERFHRPVFVLGRNARMAWRRAPAAAFPRSICWMRWNPCRTCSCVSAATSTPRA